MFKHFALLCLALALSGCGGMGQFLFPFTRAWGSPAPDSTRVTPSFLLEGRAARLQDSLRPQLVYLSTSPSPKGLELRRLEFRNTPDSAVQLVATYEDDRRINSHGLAPEQVRGREAERLLELRPLQVPARQAKLSVPLVVRAAFKSRDYLYQNRPMLQDTAEVLLPDSVAKTPK